MLVMEIALGETRQRTSKRASAPAQAFWRVFNGLRAITVSIK
jgi:hypothetical protein